MTIRAVEDLAFSETVSMRKSAEDLIEARAQGSDVRRLELAELFQDEPLLDGGEDRLHG
jgi:hypothetical protein